MLIVDVVAVKTGAVNEELVKPECVELTEECVQVSGLTVEALSAAAPLEQALNQVREKTAWSYTHFHMHTHDYFFFFTSMIKIIALSNLF